jgi:enoyl-CoA hydratase/carnithine racemase
MTTPPPILSHTADGITTLTLNRPEARNTLNLALIDALATHVQALHHDDSRVVILTGAGDHCFCAGFDTDERDTQSPADLRALLNKLRLTFSSLASLPKPVIAAINGLALGPGWELAMCADIRLAAQNATLSFNEVRLAMIPSAGGTARLTHLIGPAKAKELLMKARRIRAPEAERIGLVNAVVPDEDLPSHALQWASDFLQASPLALQQAKLTIDAAASSPLSSALTIEALAIDSLLPTEDRQEALAAFSAKRKAQFKGR